MLLENVLIVVQGRARMFKSETTIVITDSNYLLSSKKRAKRGANDMGQPNVASSRDERIEQQEAG